ncbi:MAG: hypothetical protein IPG99_12220 [Ignavibacteria bacterium]|nr:hypothetical protein [Ignavibacteria bacterium]
MSKGLTSFFTGLKSEIFSFLIVMLIVISSGGCGKGEEKVLMNPHPRLSRRIRILFSHLKKFSALLLCRE